MLNACAVSRWENLSLAQCVIQMHLRPEWCSPGESLGVKESELCRRAVTRSCDYLSVYSEDPLAEGRYHLEGTESLPSQACAVHKCSVIWFEHS